MAMRPRGGRSNIPNRPPRVGRVYEQFKPMSEWRQEDDYDTLLVYLPGFQKEYIKVTTEDLNIVRVRGERLISENRWSRFQEDYRVPENCEMRGIRARFDGGILTITMPRKIINPPPPPSTATTTQVAPETEEQPPKRTKQEAALPKPKEPKEKKPDKPQTTPLEANTLPPQSYPHPLLQPQTQTAPASSSTPTKQQPSKPTPEAKQGAATLPKDVPKKVVEKPNVGEKTNLDKGKGKETLLKEETKRDHEGSKGKPNHEGVASGGEQEEKKNVVTRRGMVMMNEDRKALLNVGVGILVIVALGVHVSYTIGLIGKEK